jgi:hypothetical protein
VPSIKTVKDTRTTPNKPILFIDPPLWCQPHTSKQCSSAHHRPYNAEDGANAIVIQRNWPDQPIFELLLVFNNLVNINFKQIVG